ncbi:MAG TPA: DUF433 domain-containing protein [Patescibacteria group bacterium]|nr:DUF433 domain-containing protein [Patescibacteria group bacterium]
MGKKHQKDKQEQRPVRVFGRIVTQADKFEGRPFILGRGVELAEVLDMLHAEAPDAEISKRFHVPKEDIDLCRAWRVMFERESLSAKFTRLADPQNFFMLDENASERMMYDIARIFGRCTHARAEGLVGARNDDTAFVWAHAVKNNYKAFLTADSDFRGIVHRYRQEMINKYGAVDKCPEPVPVVIFYNNQNSPEEVVKMLERHQDAIRDFAIRKDAAYATLTSAGLVKCESDNIWAASHPANRI